MTRALPFVLLLLAAAVSAQQAPTQTPPQEPAVKERRPLNLRLENPASFATTAPAEKEPAKGLPTLGGDARPVAPSSISESPAFPKDTNPGK